jgi:hypothetical protein
VKSVNLLIWQWKNNKNISTNPSVCLIDEVMGESGQKFFDGLTVSVGNNPTDARAPLGFSFLKTCCFYGVFVLKYGRPSI